MRIDLVGEQFQLHLLLLIVKFLLIDLRFINLCFSLFQLCDHGSQIGECCGQFIVSLHGVDNLIIIVRDLVHGKTQSLYSCTEIFRVKRNDQCGNANAEQ